MLAALGLDGFDLLHRNIELAVVIEGMDDGTNDHGEERACREPPDLPDQSEGHQRADHRENKSGTGVFRHVDRFEAVKRAHIATLFHVPPGIEIIYLRRKRKVILRRRRRGRPFQCAPIPGIAAVVAQFVPFPVTYVHLYAKGGDTRHDKQGADCGNIEIGAERGIRKLAQASGNAHQTECVERHEGQVKADQPEPEGYLTPVGIEAVTKGFRKPEDDAGEQAKQYPPIMTL